MEIRSTVFFLAPTELAFAIATNVPITSDLRSNFE
jgi:hypothetical protein